MEVTNQADLDLSITLLSKWLEKNAPEASINWLKESEKKIISANSDAPLFMTFSSIPRYFDSDVLPLSENDLKQFSTLRKNWHPSGWSSAQLARTYLLLNFAKHRGQDFKKALDKIFAAADVNELITLYQALPLFPNPNDFLLHATNGIRSNMLSVFDAIALNNPYPADFFDEIGWNQVVLKTLHVDSKVEQIIGLKRRANPQLAKALMNTAEERYAANRKIRPELWSLIGFSSDAESIGLLKSFLDDKRDILRDGALLALNCSQLPEAKKLLDQHAARNKEMQSDIQKGQAFEKALID
ncbi:MAG: EboA domain-containing protein [Gammaproteobacteria bacterium]|nr:EboA domain-containing protein [Gammaproteobacteria bacterium]